MPLHYTEHFNAAPRPQPAPTPPGLSLNQQFLTALASVIFVLTLLAVPVKNADELSARFGQEDWVAVWEIREGWPPQWKQVAAEWAALGIGYGFLFKLLGTERRDVQTFGWLKRAARERARRRHGREA